MNKYINNVMDKWNPLNITELLNDKHMLCHPSIHEGTLFPTRYPLIHKNVLNSVLGEPVTTIG